MTRYPYNVFLRSADGIVVLVGLIYGLFAIIFGMAYGSGMHFGVSGIHARIQGALFLFAAISYLAWIKWRAACAWKAKIIMRVSIGAFISVLFLYLWMNLK